MPTTKKAPQKVRRAPRKKMTDAEWNAGLTKIAVQLRGMASDLRESTKQMQEFVDRVEAEKAS